MRLSWKYSFSSTSSIATISPSADDTTALSIIVIFLFVGTLKNDTDQIMIMMPITLNPTGIALIVNWKTKFNRTKNNTTIVTIDAITLYPFLCIYMY